MKNYPKVFENDILTFKKTHPCGGNTWRVIRPGVDMKLECTTCKRIIIMPRIEVYKKIKPQPKAKE